MGKYLIQATYTQEGIKGLLKEGGTARHAAVAKTIQAFGGTLDAMYWAFGNTDVFLIVDIPEQAGMVALSLIVTATGAMQTAVTVLITPEEIDQATRLAAAAGAAFRAPGQ